MLNEPSDLGTAGLVADAFAGVDAERKAYLDWIVKRGGTCRGCGATVGDAQLQLHPGVCGTCHRKKHLTPLKPPAPVAAPEPDHQEGTMPRGKPSEKRTCCDSNGTRHRAICPTQQSKAPAAGRAPKAEKVQALPVRRAKAPTLVRVASSKLFDTQEATVEQLVETIAACRAELEERQEQLRAQLEAVAKAIGTAA
jgi:hypothetical protein